MTPETPSTRYATRYYNEEVSYSGATVYKVGKIGDATKETYLGIEKYSWHYDYDYFVNDAYPFFMCGGFLNFDTFAGVFCSHHSNGDNDSGSFRVVLCARLMSQFGLWVCKSFTIFSILLINSCLDF